MRIAVTGASGRLGRSVYATLSSRGHEVLGVDLDLSRPCCDVAADLRDPAETYAWMARLRPDAVVHLAGLPTPFSRAEHVLFATNTLMSFQVCQAAADLGVGVVVCASSPTVIGYGNPSGWAPARLPIDETHPVRPWHAYAMSKVAIEDVVRGFAARADAGARFLTFRPCYVVAPEDWTSPVEGQSGHTMTQRLADPELAAVSLFNYIDARDAAELVALMCENTEAVPNGDVLFAGAADALARAPLAELLPTFHPSTARFADVLTGDRPAFSSAKAAALLGWAPRHSWRSELATPA